TSEPLVPIITFVFLFSSSANHRDIPSFPTRRSSDLAGWRRVRRRDAVRGLRQRRHRARCAALRIRRQQPGGHGRGPRSGHERRRSEEHTSELQSRGHLVCRLLLEKKKIGGSSGKIMV